MKNWKNLFIKDEDESEQQTSSKSSASSAPSFPLSEGSNHQQAATNTSPLIEEILEVYENGLKSINMPGYDFFEFYNTIKAGGSHSEAVYRMAFQMGKTMDSNISTQKLISDADYYISKIREVHESYSEQGRKKLASIESKLKGERDILTSEVSNLESEINRMKQQIQTMEAKLTETRAQLAKVAEPYLPNQAEIKEKLVANDQAMQSFVQKLVLVQSSISKYL